jgi:hypothetical protein
LDDFALIVVVFKPPPICLPPHDRKIRHYLEHDDFPADIGSSLTLFKLLFDVDALDGRIAL